MNRLSVMRIVALVAGLVLAHGSLFAQMRDPGETNPWPASRNAIGMPDDDEGDDEGDDCPANLSPVPQTGQTECWDQDGIPISCAGTGQDGEYQKGVAVSPRFTDNLDGTVTDNLTGLIWLKNANCFGVRNWTTALADANTLADDGSCGLIDGSVAGDWRLPNLRELQSLIDYGKLGPATALPAGHPFSGVQSHGYWSSTPFVFNPINAWVVPLNVGNLVIADKAGTDFVWPVRGGQ